MKSRYQRWFWPVVLADVIMLIVILVTGPAAYQKIQARASDLISIEPTMVPTKKVEPLLVEVIIPEKIIEQRDFPLTIKIKNNSTAPVTIHEVILPRAFMDNMIFKQSEPLFAQKNVTAVGDGYPMETVLNPQEEKAFIFIFQAKKMQALNEKILIRSELGTLEKIFMMAVAPDSQTQPYVDESYPFQALVKITAMHLDANGVLQPGWSGVGSLITSDGLILTNAHLVLANRSLPVDALMVSLVHGQDIPLEDSYYAEVIQADYYLDLAVIQITTDLQDNLINKAALKLPVVEFGDPTRNVLGRRLSVLGLPETGRQLVTQISGDISGFTYQNPYGDKAFIQISSNIPASFSGGMALDEHGKLLAIPVMNISPKGLVGGSECRYLADSNGDRTINTKDLCMPGQGVLGGLRSVEMAIPMVEAAKRGESKISVYAHDLIRFPKGNKVMLEENFADHESGWMNASTKAKFGAYDNSSYQIGLTGPGQIGVTYYQYNRYTDSVLNVDINEVTQAKEAFYGVVCRYTNIENYYLFAVTTDGRYSIHKVENDQFSVLVPWTYSPSIPINSDIHMAVSCVNNTLTMAINGIPMAQVNNTSHWRGLAGLAAGTFASEHYSIGFDDLVIQTP